MSPTREDEVIHDWNAQRPTGLRAVRLHDETLRDGLQSPSVRDPDLSEKLDILRLVAAVGVDSADLGLPGAGARARDDIRALLELIRDEALPIQATVACRTHPADIGPAIDLAAETGVPVEAMMFLGTSPIRLYAESWSEQKLEDLTRAAMRQAREGGLGASYVTEDTIRSKPSTLERLFTAAIEEGADCLVLCDTVGHATPDGVRALFGWTRELLARLGVDGRVTLDWHGHNDRGLALANTLASIEAGAARVHGTMLGIGERVGNTALDQVMVNLKVAGVDARDLTRLDALVHLVSAACGAPIDTRYPAFGADAFRTGTGVHAAAVIKAKRKGDDWLADRVYSAVPAQWVGRRQEIQIDYMSGASNVRWFLEEHGLSADEDVVEAVLSRAKTSKQALSIDEVRAVVDASQARRSA
ncbi:MAG: 2-isopropylmalate synthase [Alphaproteobacteria bacterium]|nr:2-isopropylmalate synthase [Alphaproteobacteria bacterium]